MATRETIESYLGELRPKARDLCALLLLYRGSSSCSSICALASSKFGFYHLRSINCELNAN